MEPTRRFIQAASTLLNNGYLAVLASGHIYRGPLKEVCLPVLNCYACPAAIFACPVGSIQHFVATGAVPLAVIGGLALIGLLLGRMSCGWLCPFGLLQDLLYKIQSPKVQVPQVLGYFKYIVLVVLVLAIPFLTGAPWFSRLCPQGTLTAGIPWVLINPRDPVTGQAIIGAVGGLFALKLLILGGFLVWFVAAKRPFCRTTCPLGAILSLFNGISLVRLQVAHSCRGCGRCQTLCPVDHRVSESPNSGECVRCLACTACKNVTLALGQPVAGVRPAGVPERSR